MITGTLGLLLNLSFVFVLSLSIAVLSAHWFLPKFLQHAALLSAPARRTLLWLIALTFWLAPLLGTAVLSYPILFGAVPLLHDVIIIHHPNTFELMSWHSIVLFTTIAYTLIRLTRILLSTRRQWASWQWLPIITQQKDTALNVIETNTPKAFSAGFVSPKGYISSSLSAQLTSAERRVVEQHELAHCLRRDPLKKLLFAVITCILSPRVAQALRTTMSITMEQCADLDTCTHIKDTAFVAMTLVKVSRITQQHHLTQQAKLTECHFARDAIEARVLNLISPSQRSLLSLPALIGLLVLLSLACAFSTEFVHHLIELRISHTD